MLPAVADMDRLKKQGMKPKMKNEEHPAVGQSLNKLQV